MKLRNGLSFVVVVAGVFLIHRAGEGSPAQEIPASSEEVHLVGPPVEPIFQSVSGDGDVAYSYCSSSACCDQGGCCSKLLGFIEPSEPCFTDFISPVTNPVYFENPRTLTELRLLFIQHRMPPALGSDDIRLFAAQIRVALSDRLSIVAAKDGFITSNSPLINDGWADIMAGLKYELLSDPEAGYLLSAGFGYELPIGSTRSLQGNGDGLLDLYLTGGVRLGERGHWISTTGLLLPFDTSAESQVWFWSNHFDHELCCSGVYVFTEFNWYHWMRAGRASGLGVEGLDLFNFGSTGVAGNDIVTGAFGLKFKPSDETEIGVAWEFPLTQRRDVIDNRITVDWIFRY